MRVLHRPSAGDRAEGGARSDDAGGPPSAERDRVLAADARVADSLWGKARGLMFRRTFPDWGGLVFPFDRVVTRSVHMVFVPFPIDVLFLVDGRAERVDTLAGWTGFARARADTIVELPGGTANAVVPGDRIRLVPSAD